MSKSKCSGVYVVLRLSQKFCQPQIFNALLGMPRLSLEAEEEKFPPSHCELFGRYLSGLG
jgi:hypothetical protein